MHNRIHQNTGCFRKYDRKAHRRLFSLTVKARSNINMSVHIFFIQDASFIHFYSQRADCLRITEHFSIFPCLTIMSGDYYAETGLSLTDPFSDIQA